MRSLRTIVLLTSLFIVAFCCFQLYRMETNRRAIKEDLIELSMIKYGLFSVDEWKQIITTILSKKVGEFHFSGEQRTEMREKISGFLYKAIDGFEDRFYKDNEKSLGGFFKNAVAGITGTFNVMREDVPIFTEQILDFMSKEENREKIKTLILEKINEYTDKTFSRIDYATHDQILAKYQLGDRQATIAGMKSEIGAIERAEVKYSIAVFAVVAIVCIFLFFSFTVTKMEFWLYILISLSLLGAGLTLPMIEIDARITEMSFTLLGEDVGFHDQVLYYKSKSILEVVQLMMQQSKWDVKLVGFLVLMFSVLFPLFKLLSSIVYIYNPALERYRFVRFMVFRTGKWSMADVMVVAIFMSYIGFSGILTEQLSQLENLTRSLDIVTTNKSSLQLGFFLFTAFVLLSLIVSHKIQYGESKNERT